jgi:hypothetical protein
MAPVRITDLLMTTGSGDVAEQLASHSVLS